MIYIINHTFIVGVRQPQVLSKSVLKRIEIQKAQDRRAVNIGKSPLESGKTYKLIAIKTNKHKLIYSFLEINTKKTIPMEFDSTGDADEFIARISGDTDKLKQARKRIVNASTGSF